MISSTTWEVLDHGLFLAVSWRAGTDAVARQAYDELNISELRDEARRLRGEGAEDRTRKYEVWLRTLGQELDAEQVQMSAISEKDGEFVVMGVVDGRYLQQSYGKNELHELREQRLALRAAPPVTTPKSNRQRSWWPF